MWSVDLLHILPQKLKKLLLQMGNDTEIIKMLKDIGWFVANKAKLMNQKSP